MNTSYNKGGVGIPKSKRRHHFHLGGKSGGNETEAMGSAKESLIDIISNMALRVIAFLNSHK